MIVKLRRCCCDLPTFVTLVSSLFSAFHFCVILGTSLWFSLFAQPIESKRNKKSLLPDNEPVREVNDENYESFVRGKSVVQTGSRDDSFDVSLDLVIFAIVVVLAIVGLIVNALVVVGVKIDRRWLFLPWLVFHLMAIMGCFAGGIYLALHYTLLQPTNASLENQAMAITSLFPIVGGVFLIFLWVLYDQAFIGMGQPKNAEDEVTESVHTSSTSVNHKSISSSGFGSNVISVDYATDVPALYIRSPTSRKTSPFPDKHVYAKTQSLPRLKGRRHKIREFSVNLDMNLLKMKKAKSLEQILDEGSSGSSVGGTPNVWIAEGHLMRSKQERSPGLKNLHASTSDFRSRPARSSSFDNILLGTLEEIKQQQHQNYYFSADRRGPKLTTFTPTKDQMTPRPSSAIPRRRTDYDREDFLDMPRSRPLSRSRRARSAEYLLETEARPFTTPTPTRQMSTFLSAWEGEDNQMPIRSRRISLSESRGVHRNGSDTVRSVQSVKSVTIAPKVTEFHYTENLDTSMVDPGFTSQASLIDDSGSLAHVPEPVFPNPPPPLPHTRHSSWINKFSPIKPKTGFTRDQIIQYYCSGGDVAL